MPKIETRGRQQGVAAISGAVAPSERLLRFAIQAPISVEDFWAISSEMSDKLRAKLAMLSREQLAELRREVIEALNSYSSNGVMSIPAEVLIVSGGKERS